MGMYDEVRCEYPLPVEGLSDRTFQTKDTPAQSLDVYIIAADGTLRHVDYDIEDQSDPNAEGIAALFGCATRVNASIAATDFTGEIHFYDFKDNNKHLGWVEFSAKFSDGKLEELRCVEDRTA